MVLVMFSLEGKASKWFFTRQIAEMKPKRDTKSKFTTFCSSKYGVVQLLRE